MTRFFDRLKESVRYLRLRLIDPSSRVVILALTLTEAVVKNCGHLVHLEIATEAFMDELEDLHRVRVCEGSGRACCVSRMQGAVQVTTTMVFCLQSHSNKRGRDSLEIASRVLELVQAWGEAFLPYRVCGFPDCQLNDRQTGGLNDRRRDC